MMIFNFKQHMLDEILRYHKISFDAPQNVGNKKI